MTLILGLLWLLVASCSSSMYPVTTGAHVHQQPWGLKTDRYVVWANDPQVTHLITGALLQWGLTVVERARLQQIFDEQKITLMHTPDDTQTVLRVGRLVGATHVVFIESEVRPHDSYNSYGGFYVNVALRNVAIESGEVKWSGTGQYVERTSSPDIALLHAVVWAFLHATCDTENGYIWKPAPVGCTKSGSEHGQSPHPTVWSDLQAYEVAQLTEQIRRADQRHQAEYQWLAAEAQKLTAMKQTLDQQKTQLDSERVNTIERQAHFAEYMRQYEEYIQRLAKYNERNAAYELGQKRATDYAECVKTGRGSCTSKAHAYAEDKDKP